MYLAKNINAAGIVIFTKTGNGAKLLAAYKSSLPVLVCTRSQEVVEKLGYYYGIIARKIDWDSEVTHERISSQCQIIKNPENRPFVLISDTDKINGHYPTIQVIGKNHI